jgi:hypothetical protein
MIGKIYRITGKFSPTVGMKLAASLIGGVAYGYKRSSWPEIQKWSKAREYYFLELESQRNFAHLKKMSNIRHLIIEETDILLPEYTEGNFEPFAKELQSLTKEHGIDVYFNSTWKEDDLTSALKKHGLEVEDWIWRELPKTEITEKVQVQETPRVEQESFLVVPVKEQPKIIHKPKDKKIENKQVDKKIEHKQVEKKVEDKPIVKSVEKREDLRKPKEKERIKFKEEKQSNTPDDLELFFSEPKTKWQKVKDRFSRIIEKIVNNF